MGISSLLPRGIRCRLAPLTALIGLVSFALAASGAAPAGVLDLDHPALRTVKALQDRITPEVMTWPDVLGTAIGLADDDEPALVVYVDRNGRSVADVVQAFPPRLVGTAVRIEITEKFTVRAGKPGGSTPAAHQVKQTPPIQLGTSGGWEYDLANGYCCGGTLGALVNIDGAQYILSNYHVLEADIVDGGNSLVATTGQPVIQPGLIDVNCNAVNAQPVAELVVKQSLPNSNVDVGVAEVLPGMVDSSGKILGIGTLSASIVGPSLNQAVKKSGRTTGLTRSKVSALNATVSVTYENECAGGTAFTKTYTGQIVVANRGRNFLDGGDSGSVMVQDVASNPKAVGLLFAGSSTSAIANPIGAVLSFLGATMVGN